MRSPSFLNQARLRLRQKTRAGWKALFALCLSAALCVSLGACNQATIIQYHGEVPFSDCGESPYELLNSCPTERCVGVYLVPWCSYCTQLMPVIHDLPEKAWRRGMSACAIVGHAPMEQLRDYATRHSLSPLYDVEGVIPINSYPTMFLFDKSGTIQKTVSGIYREESGFLSPPETYLEHLLLD